MSHAHDILEHCHLPANRLALAAFVGELRASSDPESLMHGKLRG